MKTIKEKIMKTTKEKIEVMQAYERGEQIQINNSKNVWEDIDCPLFDWANCNYRVKPKLTEYPKTGTQTTFKLCGRGRRVPTINHLIINIFTNI